MKRRRGAKIAPMNDAAAQNRNEGAKEFCATSVTDEERLSMHVL